ncbi:hypothetical protein EGT07_22455 [Herbaspirillum sp. HC18]|nr:hypothetical protein EGT07_22455 [Herbaspirillum sp. HC18]
MRQLARLKRVETVLDCRNDTALEQLVHRLPQCMTEGQSEECTARPDAFNLYRMNSIAPLQSHMGFIIKSITGVDSRQPSQKEGEHHAFL